MAKADARTGKTERPLFLGYDGCTTCKRARAFLATAKIDAEIRPIVEQPPTVAELRAWIPASGLPLKRWFNTSGQSYRALGKETVQGLSDAEAQKALAADGKLVKRPVLVLDDGEGGKRVLVGFDEDAWKNELTAR
jgi:arsenate reductase